MTAVPTIVAAVAEAAHIETAALIGECRLKSTTYARRLLYYILRTETAMSYPEIGMHLQRTHDTVLRGARAWELEMALDPLAVVMAERARTLVRAALAPPVEVPLTEAQVLQAELRRTKRRERYDLQRTGARTKGRGIQVALHLTSRY